MEDEYLVVDPKISIAGCLAVVVKRSKYQLLSDIENKKGRRRFTVRAYLSDHIPLYGSIDEIMSRTLFHCIKIDENPLSIYLHHGGRNVVYYNLCSDKDGYLKYIELEIESEIPGSVFIPARTIINELIDSLQRGMAIPLVIVRIDILLKGMEDAFVHQLVLPYSISLNIGPLGGIHQHPAFSSYEAVLREAITSPSPYYRLLCAYKLYDGLNKLKKWLKTVSEEIGVNERLPKDPKIDGELLSNIGFDLEKLGPVTNMNDLWKKFTNLRDLVAHYYLNKDEDSIHLSHGATYHEYSIAAAVLLHYSNVTFSNLFIYFNKYLNSKLSVGSILPMKEDRDKFILKL